MTTPNEHLGHHIGPTHDDIMTINTDASLLSVLARLANSNKGLPYEQE